MHTQTCEQRWILSSIRRLFTDLLQPCVDGKKATCEIKRQFAIYHSRAIERFTRSLLNSFDHTHTFYRLMESRICSSRRFNLLVLGRHYDLPIAIYGNNFFSPALASDQMVI